MVKRKNIPPMNISPAHKAVSRVLASGRSFTKIELASAAKLQVETTQGVLNDFNAAELLYIHANRRPYYRFKNEKIMSDAISREGATANSAETTNISDLHYCRSCYQHLAGVVGVKVTQALVHRDYIQIVKVNGRENFEVTEDGESFFQQMGIDTEALKKENRRFIKACLDFSQRRYHLGGNLGVALLESMKKKGWFTRVENSRVHKLTPRGKSQLKEVLGIQL